MFDATALTVERGKTHGDFAANATVSQQFKKIMCSNGAQYTAVMQEALDMIALKLSRIASGNPYEPDHWRDIAGYATLVVQELEKQIPNSWLE